jgi:hypothetical protein
VVRRLVLVVTAVMLVNAFAATAANAAKVPPVTGEVGVCFFPNATFKPALTPSTPAKGATSVTAKAPIFSFNCAGSSTSGGKAPIDAGTVTFHWRFGPGLDCATLSSATAENATATVKFQNDDGKRPITVATVRMKLGSTDGESIGQFVFEGTLAQNKAGTKPFGGDSFQFGVVLHSTACAGGPTTSMPANGQLRIG